MKTGTYMMKVFDFTDQYKTFPVKVEIINEIPKNYRVKLLERGPNGQHIGTMYWPRKRNVVNIKEF
jgi:hypothetical protein